MPSYTEGEIKTNPATGAQVIFTNGNWVAVPAAYTAKNVTPDKTGAPLEGERAAGIGKSALAGLGNAAASLAGAPTDLIETGAQVVNSATGGNRPPEEPRYGSAQIKRMIEDSTGKFYEPQTGFERAVRGVTENAPNLLGGGGNILAKVGSRMIAPYVAGEVAEGAFSGNPTAKTVGSMAGELLGRKMITPNPADAGRMAAALRLERRGVNATAAQRTGSKTLNDIEKKVGYPDDFGPEAQTQQLSRALAGARSQRAADAIQRDADRVLTPLKKGNLDTYTHAATLGADALQAGLGVGFLGPAALLGAPYTMAINHAIAPKATGWILGHAPGLQKAMYSDAGQAYLANQLLQKSGPKSKALSSVVYSGPERRGGDEPEELPEITVTGRK